MISPVKIWRNQQFIRKYLGQTGRIVSYTIIRIAPVGFEQQVPYPLVLVQLGKERKMGQLVDWHEKHLKIGQKVEAVLRRVREPDAEGVIPYGIKFRPIN